MPLIKGQQRAAFWGYSTCFTAASECVETKETPPKGTTA